MALLEGPPVIAEDLLEGVFVDSLPCGCHRAWLYHVLAPRSTRLCTLLRPSLPLVSPCRDRQKGGFSKRKFLYARVGHPTSVRALADRRRRPVAVARGAERPVSRDGGHRA